MCADRVEKYILVVDDEPDLRSVYVEELQYNGFKCLEADGGFRAIEMFKQYPISLIVSDMRMPHGSGIDVLKFAGFKVPVIIISGFSDISPEDAMRMGAAKLFNKPMHLDEFVSSVKDILKSEMSV